MHLHINFDADVFLVDKGTGGHDEASTKAELSSFNLPIDIITRIQQVAIIGRSPRVISNILPLLDLLLCRPHVLELTLIIDGRQEYVSSWNRGNIAKLMEQGLESVEGVLKRKADGKVLLSKAMSRREKWERGSLPTSVRWRASEVDLSPWSGATQTVKKINVLLMWICWRSGCSPARGLGIATRCISM